MVQKLYILIGKITLHVFLVVFCVFLTVLFYHLDPFLRGYSCDDVSIKYPTHLAHEGNMNYYALCFFFILIPAMLIPVVEYATFHMLIADQRDFTNLLTKIYSMEVVFLFGSFASQALAAAVKIATGRLSPNFIAVCKPAMSCDKYRFPSRYEAFECLGGVEEVRNARMSFPSEHALLSTQSMVFIILYIDGKMRLWVSATPIRNYTHHWTDVIAGILVGFFFAFYMILMLFEWFKLTSKEIGEI